MASPGGGGALFYTPEPHERPYYDGLFQAADIQRTGTIGGQDAVAFFSRSKLPMEQLKNVWTVADNPPSNSLNRPKFAVAIRLIQLLQNGVKGQGTSLAVPPGTPLRPVFLEGISGAVVPLPGGPQQQQPPPQQPSPAAPQGMPPGQQLQQPPQATTPPQQRQQPTPTPPAQQQQPPSQQQPPNGGRPPMVPQSPSNPGPGSMALTAQDPYTLVPNERARYESIFPQYAKEDGYMHGKEAVALFSKSGLSQPQLRDIWNMADQPVDNRLDKLEFAIAMHLIVCVSKKNLPMPKTLPFSLKSLKQQQDQQQQQQQQQDQQQQQQQQQQQYQQQPPGSPAQQPPSGGPSGYGQPQQQLSKPEQPQADASTMPGSMPGSMAGGMAGGMPPSGMQGPPPLAQAGGMDISDAFEGLSMGDGVGGGGMPPPTSGYGSLGGGGYGAGAAAGVAASASTSPKIEPTMAPSSMPSPPRMHHEAPQPTMAAPSMPEPPKTSETLANSYNMSDNTGELEKLRTVLQKLQAENISLKAQLGTMSEEEKDVQRQINATVAEIGDLSNRLTTLRAQVLASKSRLMEATAELKAAQEKKGVLNDLIGEAQATKDAIDSAYDGIEATVNAAQAPPAAPPAPAPAPTFEDDLFGFGPPGGHLQASPPTTAPSYDANPAGLQQQAMGSAPVPAPIPYGQHDPTGMPGAPGGQPHQIETVSSVDTSDDEQEDFNADPQAQGGQQEQMFGDYGAPAAAPHQQTPFGGQEYPNLQPPYGQEAPHAQQGISFEQGFRPNPGPHHRQSSISSNLSFEVMGGGPVPQNQFAPPPPQQQEENQFAPQQQPQARSAPTDTDDDAELVLATSMEEVNQLKSKAKEAEDLSRDSETTLRHLMKKADKLRNAADKAEVEARQKMAEATEPKKKGILGGGGKKKKSMKEATAAKHDAEAKKKQFLAAQAQANDAQAVAMETKREADKLRKQAEQAELDAAAAMSIQQKQPEPEPEPAPAPAQPAQGQPPPPTANGYQGQPQGYGQPPMGMGGPPQTMGGGPSAMGGPPPSMAMGGPAPAMGMGGPAPAMGMGGPAPAMGMGGPAPAMGMGGPAPAMGGPPPAMGGPSPAMGMGGPPPATPQQNYGQFNPAVMGQPTGGGIEIPSPGGGGADAYASYDNPF